jgi:hypothetical protein
MHSGDANAMGTGADLPECIKYLGRCARAGDGNDPVVRAIHRHLGGERPIGIPEAS